MKGNNMLEFLKTILGDAYTEELDSKISAEIGKAFVPKSEFNALNETKKTLEGTVETLKTQNADNGKLQATIKENEEKIKRLEKEKTDAEKTYALRDALREKGVSDPDYIIYKHGGVDKFSFGEDGKAEKLDDVIKTYRENGAFAHLFSDTSQHYTPSGGGNAENVNPFAKETFNLTKQGEMLRENPAAARELAAAAGIQL